MYLKPLLGIIISAFAVATPSKLSIDKMLPILPVNSPSFLFLYQLAYSLTGTVQSVLLLFSKYRFALV